MNIDKQLTRNLAHSANIINTLHGGTVFPTLTSTKSEDHIRVEVSAPSIDPDRIKVEINEDHLFIFQMVAISEVELPNVLSMIQLSRNVDLEHISASFEDDILTLILPFDDAEGGTFRKEIDIHRA